MISTPSNPSATQPYAQLPKPPETATSPYTPPTDLKPDMVNRRTQVLFDEGGTKISRSIDWDPSDPKKPQILNNFLHVETGDRADRVHVRNLPNDKLQITINDKPHVFDVKSKEDREQELAIDTHGGDDTVIIDDDVKLRTRVEGGDGDDRIQAGGGRSRLFGGRGNDALVLGSGLGYAAGGEGDDTIIGGSGNGVMYGNKGNDLLIAGSGLATKQTYMDGGDGDDVLFSGSGHTVAHGGNGDDNLVGNARTTFYTGKGKDSIWNNQPNDRIYAKAGDSFDRTQGSAFTEVKPSNAGNRGFSVDVPPEVNEDQAQEFKQSVADDFEFLRSSPTGQQALKRMDEFAAINGAKVSIRPINHGGNEYLFGSTGLENMTPEESESAGEGAFGTITNGVPGARADRGIIHFDSPATLENADRTNTRVPATALFAQVASAYNGATGTFLPGETREAPGESGLARNEVRQAIGLPSDAEPFDFDNDPSTPPSTVNPRPFTENALNEEMGKPLRKTVLWSPSDQGRGT